MKNNILIILLIFYQILFFNKLFAKEIKFDASDIEINEGQNLTNIKVYFTNSDG